MRPTSSNAHACGWQAMIASSGFMRGPSHLHEGRTYLVEDVTMPVALFPALVDEKGSAPSI